MACGRPSTATGTIAAGHPASLDRRTFRAAHRRRARRHARVAPDSGPDPVGPAEDLDPAVGQVVDQAAAWGRIALRSMIEGRSLP